MIDSSSRPINNPRIIRVAGAFNAARIPIAGALRRAAQPLDASSGRAAVNGRARLLAAVAPPVLSARVKDIIHRIEARARGVNELYGSRHALSKGPSAVSAM